VYKSLFRAVRNVVTSDIGGKFRLMFGAILLLLVGINGLNVLSSYVGRDLMTTIEQRSASRFFSTAARPGPRAYPPAAGWVGRRA